MKLYFCDEKYCVVPPSEVKDIVEEGNVLRHDAGSTASIRGILEGECVIVFMRSNEDPFAPLVTLQIRNQKVSRAAGKANRPLINEEAEFVEKYNAHLASEVRHDQQIKHYEGAMRHRDAHRIMNDTEFVLFDDKGVRVDQKDRPRILEVLSKSQWRMTRKSILETA